MGLGLSLTNYRGGGGGAADDIATLASALGDDGTGDVLLAIYDGRRNVTVSSGVVDSWADARGATGYGPALTATGVRRPGYDPVAETSNGDGVDDVMVTGTNALFDLSGAKTLVAIGAITGGNSSRYLASIAKPGTFNPSLAIRAVTTDFYDAAAAGSSSRNKSTVAIGATRRVLIATTTPGTVGIEIPDAARVTTTGLPAMGTDLCQLGVFGWDNPGSSWGAGHLRAVLVLNRVATAEDVETITAWAEAQHSAVRA